MGGGSSPLSFAQATTPHPQEVSIATSSSPPSPAVVEWGPTEGWLRGMLTRWIEIWRYRDLLALIVARDVKLRYRGTVLGFVWCLLSPLLMTIVLTLLFTVFSRANTAPNYPLFVLIGFLVWSFHANAVFGAIASITGNDSLLLKNYFPREILPIAAVLANAVNFLFTLPVLAAFLFIFGVPLGWALLLLPVAVLLQIIFLTGFAFIFATLNVFYRDTGVIMESLMLAWFFLTPIFYQPADLFPEYQRLMYVLNPPASLVAIYRDILFSSSVPDPAFLLRTAVQSVVLLGVGWAVFQRFANRFAEEL